MYKLLDLNFFNIIELVFSIILSKLISLESHLKMLKILVL